ncbi:terminase small subunit [Peribacillus loiseleuriae]|uniref:terminase small subunit n=1 Tax=Peribacillus loiseleuriae TaxID=1679170 RepID=UPI00381581B9
MIDTSFLHDEKYSYTEKELLFCQYYVKTNKGADSAIRAGYAEGSAHVRSSRLLKSEKIVTLIRSIRSEIEGSLRAYFMSDAMVAREIVKEIMEDREVSPAIRLQAAKDMLDRAGFKAVEKQEVQSNQSITVVEFNIPKPSKERAT